MTTSRLPAHGAHLGDENFAHPRDAADEGNCIVHAIVPEMFGGIDPIDQDAGSVVVQIAIDAGSLEQARNGVTVTRRDPVLQDMPGHGAIHRAGIHVMKTQIVSRAPARHCSCRTRPDHQSQRLDEWPEAFTARNSVADPETWPENLSPSERKRSACRSHSSAALEGVSELITGVVRRVRFEETNSSSAFSNPGYDSRTHSTSWTMVSPSANIPATAKAIAMR